MGWDRHPKKSKLDLANYYIWSFIFLDSSPNMSTNGCLYEKLDCPKISVSNQKMTLLILQMLQNGFRWKEQFRYRSNATKAFVCFLWSLKWLRNAFRPCEDQIWSWKNQFSSNPIPARPSLLQNKIIFPSAQQNFEGSSGAVRITLEQFLGLGWSEMNQCGSFVNLGKDFVSKRASVLRFFRISFFLDTARLRTFV